MNILFIFLKYIYSILSSTVLLSIKLLIFRLLKNHSRQLLNGCTRQELCCLLGRLLCLVAGKLPRCITRHGLRHLFCCFLCMLGCLLCLVAGELPKFFTNCGVEGSKSLQKNKRGTRRRRHTLTRLNFDAEAVAKASPRHLSNQRGCRHIETSRQKREKVAHYAN